jgi:ABC-type arginine transport system ATPase subunit
MAKPRSIGIDPDLYTLFVDIVRARRGIKKGVITEEVEVAIKLYIEKYQPSK